MISQETKIFDAYVCEQGCNSSRKRDLIVKVFLKTRGHVSAEELYDTIKKDHPQIGYTTVYRTLKMIADSGLAKITDLGDKVKRYERRVGREYHAHLICSQCGNSLEVFDQEIEALTVNLAKRQRFVPANQCFEIFGVCAQCAKKKEKKLS